MPCSCGSVTCPCRDNCFCTERYCRCDNCNAIRRDLCGICGLPTYHQTLVHSVDNVTRYCACFLSQSEVSQFGQSATNYKNKSAKGRTASKSRKVKNRHSPLSTALPDSSSKGIPHQSLHESRRLQTRESSNTLDISDCQATGYSQVKQTEKHLPVIALEETQFVIEGGHDETKQNQSPQEPQTAARYRDFNISSKFQFGHPQPTSKPSSSTISSTNDPQPPTRHHKRPNTRRKSKKGLTEETKHEVTSTSESSDCPQMNALGMPIEFSPYMHLTGFAVSSTMRLPFRNIHQEQAHYSRATISRFDGPVTYGPPVHTPFPPQPPLITQPPFHQNYFRPMPSSSTSSESANRPSRTPPREKHRSKTLTLSSSAHLQPAQFHPFFRNRSNIRNWIDSTEAARSQSSISHEKEYFESLNLLHGNAEGDNGKASISGHASDMDRTRRRVGKVSTDESIPYPSSRDNEIYLPNRNLKNYDISRKNTVSTTLNTSESSDTSADEAT